jgi:hypothetical protein
MAWTEEQAITYSRDWRKAHPKYSSQWAKDHQEDRKATRVQGKYGITAAEYSRMINEQKHRWKLCRVVFTLFSVDREKSPDVDHDHLCPNKSNHRYLGDGGCPECIRGIVCHTCNWVVVRFLELYPRRQRKAERAYMADRPILRYRQENKS